MSNQRYFLALNRMNQIGPRTIAKLYQRWPDLSVLFSMSAASLITEGIPKRIADIITTFDISKVEADLRWQDIPNHRILTWDERDYPYLLKEIYDPPPVLYAIGDLACLSRPTIAMVGTRNPTPTGQDTAKQMAYELAQHQMTIVSGLALGIDAAAHRGCLQAQGKTVAVMGTGIDCIYPLRHKKLAEEISATGLLLSEFPLGTSPIAGHFPRRNRIISGLSLSILVVEAAIRSGSLVTARLALEQNRDVLAIPGSIHNPLARGCHHLLQQGAKLVTCCDDVLHELRIDYTRAAQEELPTMLATQDENLVKCIGFEVTSVDQIIERSGWNVEKVTCQLADLEIQGKVFAVPGGYVRCTL